MKKFLLLLSLLLIPIYIIAQETGGYNSYITAGSNVKFRPYTFDGKTFLVMEYMDHGDCSLPGWPIVKFQLKDGSILKFEGSVSNSETSASSFLVGHAVINTSSTSHCVAMPITKEEIEAFKKGVEKISINTLPVVYKRSRWSGKKDFGEDLNKLFNHLKGDFED